MKKVFDTMNRTLLSASMVTLLIVICMFNSQSVSAQSVAAGSLIIPLDNSVATSQGGQANVLKAYGLVYALLANTPTVPLKWSYATSKSHNGADFSATANQVKIRFGNSTITSAFDYKGSQFIVDVADTANAGPVIRGFQANGVTVHQVLSAFGSVPIQHAMNFAPKAFVYDSDPGKFDLITGVLADAGIPSTAYTTNSTGIPALFDLICYSIVMIPHESAITSESRQNLRSFANDGGNVYLQCHATTTVENDATNSFYLSTNGITDKGEGNYVYPDAGSRIHFGQFMGNIEDQGGAVKAWEPAAGSAFRSHSIGVAKDDNSNVHKAMLVRTDDDPLKGFVFFGGGHDYHGKTNLSRLLLNAFFAPFRREGCAALPVELVSFTSTVIGKSVQLRWRTATEVNNYGFEIQRSYDAKNWVPISFVEGHGTTNTPQSYAYNDAQIGTKGSVFYYRLMQIDRDGMTDYSPVVQAKFTESSLFGIVSAYPNPFNPTTMISYNVPRASEITITLHTVLGTEVKTLVKNQVQDAGLHSIMLDATSLSSGTYFVQLQAGETISRYRIVLTR